MEPVMCAYDNRGQQSALFTLGCIHNHIVWFGGYVVCHDNIDLIIGHFVCILISVSLGFCVVIPGRFSLTAGLVMHEVFHVVTSFLIIIIAYPNFRGKFTYVYTACILSICCMHVFLFFSQMQHVSTFIPKQLHITRKMLRWTYFRGIKYGWHKYETAWVEEAHM